MKAIITALLVTLLAAFDACGQTVRVATYNVNFANRRGKDMIEVIIAANADIVCLQETTPKIEQSLKGAFAERYPFFHAVGHKGKYAAERFAIASKAELRDVAFHPPGAGLFGFYTATTRLGGKEVRIVNVHLVPVPLQSGSGGLWVMEALAQAEKTHEAEIRAIVKTIKADQPTIILGDFNSMSSHVAPRRLVELGFADSFASVTADADKHPTWRWPSKPMPLSLRINYIFHSRHFQTAKSEIIRREGSDHYLVASELRLREPQAEPPAAPAQSSAASIAPTTSTAP